MNARSRMIPGRRGRRLAQAALLAALALSAGACSMTGRPEHPVDVSSAPLDYRLRHPIAIREGERTMEVFISTRRGSLTPTQRQEIAAFARVWRREAGGGIIIDIPSGTPNARAAHASIGEIRAILASEGVPARAVAGRGYRPSDPSEMATVRLQYPRMVGQVGPCGLWPEDIGLTYNSRPTINRPYWNLGCASQRNLAAMVENPADLVQPRQETPIYAARRATAIDKYRKGESAATVYPDANKGTISDVGK